MEGSADETQMVTHPDRFFGPNGLSSADADRSSRHTDGAVDRQRGDEYTGGYRTTADKYALTRRNACPHLNTRSCNGCGGDRVGNCSGDAPSDRHCGRDCGSDSSACLQYTRGLHQCR